MKGELGKEGEKEGGKERRRGGPMSHTLPRNTATVGKDPKNPTNDYGGFVPFNLGLKFIQV